MGLSFAEINELRLRDFLGMVNLTTGRKTGVRKANQDDIDRLYGG